MPEVTHDALSSLQKLLQRAEEPILSMYMPVHLTRDEQDQNRIRLKNLLKEGEQALVDAGMSTPTARDRLSDMRQFERDRSFWGKAGVGLAILAGVESLQFFTGVECLSQMMVCGHHFHLKPLIPRLTRRDRFYLLAVQQEEVRLYEGDERSLEPMLLKNITLSLSEFLRFEEPQKQLQFHTESSPRLHGRDAIYHGHAAGRDDNKENLSRWSESLSRQLSRGLNDVHTPVVLAGVEPTTALFAQSCQDLNIMDEVIPGNHKQWDLRTLHNHALKIVTPFHDEAKCEAMGQYLQLEGEDSGLTMSELEPVLSAARMGKVAILFVPSDRCVWGAVNEETEQCIMHKTQQTMSEDLTNLAAVETLSHGGTVYLLPHSNMPKQSDVAAILRY